MTIKKYKKKKAEPVNYGANTVYIIRPDFSISFFQKSIIVQKANSLPDHVIQYNKIISNF